MQAFLEYVVKGLVDRPDAVNITPVERQGMTIYELRMHPTDIGKVIGKQGTTIHAIRSLLQVGAARKGQRCTVEIVEERPEG
ncbi:MAG TPA: KH domain-containing protein [Candidatus Angelobacter sp.]|nr:KH domain-containing protein [Candidatus Angelobacter sp.]